MSMKKHHFFAAVPLLAALLLAACTPQPMNEDAIEADFIETAGNLLPAAETLDSFEVIERNTDTETQVDEIICRIESHDDEVAYVRFYTIKYQLVDNVWTLDSTRPYREGDWAKAPTTGVSDAVIAATVTADTIGAHLGNVLVIDGEEWRIGEDNVSYLGDELVNMLIEMFIGFDIGYQSVSGIGVSGARLGDTEVVGRDTSLAQKTDKLTVSVELEHDVLTATGELEFDYTYDDGWELSDIRTAELFTTAQRPGTEFDLTEEEARAAIARHITDKTWEYGERYVNRQTLSMSPQEMTGLELVDEMATHLGTVRVYEAQYMLAKPLADFDAGATLIYQYDPAGGWGLKEVGISEPVLKTLHTDRMLGEWLGVYSAYGMVRNYSCALEITEIGANGEVVAIFHDRTADPYSIPMSGYFNAGNDLRLSIRSDGGNHPLFLGEGSTSRSREMFAARNGGLKGSLDMETSTLGSFRMGDSGLDSNTYYHHFEVTKAD